MDAELLITVNVMTLSALATALFLSRRDWSYAWSAAVHLTILFIGAAALLLGWPHPGWLTGALFIILVVAPAVLMLISQRCAAAGDAPAAIIWMRRAAFIHPTPILRYQARFMEAQAIEPPAARAAAFKAIADTTTGRQRQLAEIAAAQAVDRWDQVLEQTADATASQPERAILQIRALGETADIAGMLEAYGKLRNALPAQERFTAELFVLAFTGRLKALTAKLDRRHSPYDNETKAFWKAIAAHAGGTADRSELEKLAQSARRSTTRTAALRHLESPLNDISRQISPEAAVLLDKVAKRTLEDATFAAHPRHRAFATLLFLAANAIMFAIELSRGGSEDLATLYNLGAMWPPSIETEGEWWRLGSALFLHFGWLHLAINMLSLYILGRAVEARIGTLRMLLVYLGGGLLSSFAVLTLMQQGVIKMALLVGASGAVMALFGAIIAYQMLNWLKSRDVLDFRPLMVFFAIVVLQSAIDITLPHVSLASHLAGLIAGFILAAPLIAVRPPSPDAETSSPA